MITAVIFDLDGVIVSTDEYHYRAWKSLADRIGIHFDRTINESLRGVSRMASLDILLGDHATAYTTEEKHDLADSKNRHYRQLLDLLSPADILPGVLRLLEELKSHGVGLVIGSSSKNAPAILQKIGLQHTFDAVSDGNNILRSKPDPSVFLMAAQMLQIPPACCVVVEDAYAGIEAALAAGMKAFAVGFAAGHPNANGRAESLETVSAAQLINL